MMKLSRVLMGLLLVQVAQASELELTKESLAKWVETRKLISLEKEQWVLEKCSLYFVVKNSKFKEAICCSPILKIPFIIKGSLITILHYLFPYKLHIT